MSSVGGGKDAGSLFLRIFCIIVFILLSKIESAPSDTHGNDSEQHPVETKRQDLTPYPRIGRSVEGLQHFYQNLPGQISNGRTYESDSKKPSPKKHQSDNMDRPIIPPSEYMLPYMRPGRSDGSDADYEEPQTEDEQATMIPYPRFGRSLTKTLFYILPSEARKTGSSSIENDAKSSEEFQYMTPYPRVGKRDGNKDIITPYSQFSKLNQNPNNMLMELMKNYQPGDSDFITPYPRMGKRSYNDKIRIPVSMIDGNVHTRNSESMLPTMRLGRNMWLPRFLTDKRSNEETMIPYARLGRTKSDGSHTKVQAQSMHLNNQNDYNRIMNLLADASNSMTPYFRFGKSIQDGEDGTMLPQPRFGRSTNNNNVDLFNKRSNNNQDENSAHDTTTTTEGTLIPYPRLGRSKRSSEDQSYVGFNKKNSSNDKVKSTTSQNKENYMNLAEQSYMLPYMRPGRSNFIDRFAKLTNTGQQYPEIKNGEFVIPYPS